MKINEGRVRETGALLTPPSIQDGAFAAVVSAGATLVIKINN